MSLPKYPKYKNSRVPWLDEVPAHWEILRYKQIFKERDERSSDGSEMLLSVSAYTGVSPRSQIIDEGEHLSRAESLEGYKICYPNDLVMNIMLAWNRGLGITSYHGIVSPAYCVFRITNGAEPRFLDYIMRSDQSISYYKAFSSGVIDSRLRLYPDTFGSLFCALPPRNEQVAIADFLDHETAKVDALIAEQDKLLALLTEKRQVTISHAVSRGLDSNAPMKDSGIPWLGDIPEHWAIGGLTKFIGPVVDYRGRTPTKGNEGMFLVTAKNVRGGAIDYEASQEFVDPAEAEILLSRGAPKAGDVLFTTEAPLGQVAQIDRTDIALAQRIVKFRGLPGIMQNRFLMYWLMGSACQARLEALATGSTALGIKASKLGMIECVAPPVEEQKQIVDYVDAQLGYINSLKLEAGRAIDLLGKRRSALISAAVTGKIDLRCAV